VKDRLLVVVSLVFAVVAGGLYFGSMGAPPAPAVVAVRTPAATPTPAPRRPLKQPEFAQKPVGAPELNLAPRTSDEPPPPHPFATVRGRALLSGGSPAINSTVLAYIGGRRKVFAVDDDGRFEFRMPGAPYKLRAERQDGQLTTASDWVEIDTSEGGEWEVDLVVPEQARGGLGIRIGRHTDGIRVRAVLPGSPAKELGMREGDVVIAVGGDSAEGWTTGEFAEVMAGAIGTEQSFTVRHADGELEDLVFERRFLER
jgi:hypothetical protein